jgi:hypothetical protein
MMRENIIFDKQPKEIRFVGGYKLIKKNKLFFKVFSFNEFVNQLFEEIQKYIKENKHKIGSPIYNLTEYALKSLGMELKGADIKTKIQVDYEERDIHKFDDLLGKNVNVMIRAIEIFDYVENYYKLVCTVKAYRTRRNSHLFHLTNNGSFEYIEIFKFSLQVLINEKHLRYL